MGILRQSDFTRLMGRARGEVEVGVKSMPCKSCHSVNQSAYRSQINIHPPQGLRNLDRPTVWAFPLPVICTECGFAEFVSSKPELHQRRYNHAKNWTQFITVLVLSA